MDRETLLLELKGLSRVVDDEVRNLAYKRRAVLELADLYEPVNPYWVLLDEIEADLMEAVQHGIFDNLSEGEQQAFTAQWKNMRRDQQITCIEKVIW
jgi:ABC-type branched-subunit amino acid transport system ATPase component